MSMETELLTDQGRWAKRKREAMKSYLISLAGGKCQLCSYNKYIGALAFHHINPNDKEFEIKGGVLTYSLEKLLKEVAKCALLCNNCHAEYHAGFHNNIKLTPITVDLSQSNVDVLSIRFGRKNLKPNLMVEMSCPNCQTTFVKKRKQTQLSRTDKKCCFCSSSCISVFNSKNKNNPDAYLKAGKLQIIRVFEVLPP